MGPFDVSLQRGLMTSKERMALAMRRRAPDRAPVMCQLSLGHYFLHAGLPAHRVWFTSEGFSEALLTLRARYGFDGALINLPGRDPGWMREVEGIEEGPEGEVVRWRNGDRTVIPPDDNPAHRPADPARAGRAEFSRLDPDHLEVLDRLPMYTWNVYHTPYLTGKPRPGPFSSPGDIPEYFCRAIDLVKAAVGETVSVHGEVFSPFTHYMELFGYEAGLMGLVDDPGRAEAMLDRLTGACVAWGVAQARRGVDAVLISSAFAGGGFVSRANYRRFVMPFERRVVEAVHAEGLPVYVHTCGAIGDRLELMAEAGLDGIDTLDPPPLGTVDLAEAKAQVGDRVFFKGNVDPVNTLLNGTPEGVMADARRRLEIGMPGGGYILSTACSVAPRTPPENIAALRQAVEVYGRYGG